MTKILWLGDPTADESILQALCTMLNLPRTDTADNLVHIAEPMAVEEELRYGPRDYEMSSLDLIVVMHHLIPDPDDEQTRDFLRARYIDKRLPVLVRARFLEGRWSFNLILDRGHEHPIILPMEAA